MAEYDNKGQKKEEPKKDGNDNKDDKDDEWHEQSFDEAIEEGDKILAEDLDW